MFDTLKKKVKNFFTSNDQEETEDYSNKLTNTPEMYHMFIYKNERLLKLDKVGNYLWYVCFSKTDSSTLIHFIEFLQFISTTSTMRIYTVLDKVHILVSLDVIDMSQIYDNYISYGVHHQVKTNMFVSSLLEDISLDIPQSYIQGMLNKAIEYHRTTLDGELDEDFKEIKDKKSKFPLHLDTYKGCYIKEADSIYDIRSSIQYVANTMNIFISDEELLMFGRIMLSINDIDITVSLSKVFDILPTELLANELLSEEELDDFFTDLCKVCGSNDLPLVALDPPESDFIHPEESDEEIIEKEEIKVTLDTTSESKERSIKERK